MTEGEFFGLLEQTPRDWYFLCNRIRRTKQTFCPVESVCVLKGFKDPKGAYTTGLELGLEKYFNEAIISAADQGQIEGKFDPVLRAKLLKAVDLQESE